MRMNDEERIRRLENDLGTALQRIEAIEDALGALVILATGHIPAEGRAALEDRLAALAATAESMGDMASATLLTNLHAAAAARSRG